MNHMSNTTTDRPVFIKHCTMCGKELNEYELDPTLTFDLFPGYGSRYDMDHIHMELCWDCFDKIIDWIRPQCEKDPVIEEDVDDGFGVPGAVLDRLIQLGKHLSPEGFMLCNREMMKYGRDNAHDYVEKLEEIFGEPADSCRHKEHQKGVFWVIDGELHAFPFTGEFAEAAAKSGTNYNHKLLWQHVKPRGCNKPFDYYPRGRVETNSRSCPVIYMNPNIGAEIIPQIRNAFGMTEEPVIHYDGSWHYRCHLDNEEDET